ncbi:ankyrin repeat domain-containing protein SOWAHB [Mastacembelus armatus]|uniref:ankyrin repeat domain-containing protein SOWAHB n=1 Tax=Mastacembelus armatus TaxID=205130 RepID=UPI000E45E61C|nr:ankyrin repeat domain-containing protein SOWAHB-like [Mastacembelus armatus]
MVLTQQSVLALLIAEGGKVKKNDLVGKFKDSVDCVDPANRERNRELFKTFVNNVASVKEIDGVRYVVVKKIYHHLLEGARTAESRVEKRENKEPTGEQQRPPVRREKPEMSEAVGGERSAVSELDQEQASENDENPTELLTPIELALQRCRYTDIQPRRMLNVEIQKQDINRDKGSRRGAVNEPPTIQSKPYALPLRMPPSATRVEIHKLKVDPHDPPETPKPDTFKNKKRPPSVDTGSSISSPQLRRALKTTKVPEEPRDTKIPSMVPLEHSEHQWLVTCASGHWSQVYGLLLRDSQLAEKRDFMSGFTALHWAAKCGNGDMLVKIIDLAKQEGVDIDINAKTHGGYTPLHIAALHNQEYMMAMLVGEYEANVNIRDNNGKKASHYLHKGVSSTVRDMLAGPKPRQAQDKNLEEKEELDLVPDLSKSLHSISRIFQPHGTGYKKKHKLRPGLYSLSDDPSEEREGSSSGFRNSVRSDAFM